MSINIKDVQQWMEEDDPFYEHLVVTDIVDLVWRAGADGGGEYGEKVKLINHKPKIAQYQTQRP